MLACGTNGARHNPYRCEKAVMECLNAVVARNEVRALNADRRVVDSTDRRESAMHVGRISKADSPGDECLK